MAAAAAANNTQFGAKKEGNRRLVLSEVTESTNEIWWSFPPVFRIELSEHLARHTNNTKENVVLVPSVKKILKSPLVDTKEFLLVFGLNGATGQLAPTVINQLV